MQNTELEFPWIEFALFCKNCKYAMVGENIFIKAADDIIFRKGIK